MRLAKAGSLIVVVAALVWLAGCGPSTPAGQAATISGFVFRDLNANGARDAREPGEPGILVSAYDVSNRFVISATTDVDGNYVLNAELDAAKIVFGQSYAVLFTGLPPGVVSGPAGKDSGTEVQFVAGGAGHACFGVFNPDQYTAPRPTPPG